MPGPRAPIGTLQQHATAAAGLVRGMVPSIFTRDDPSKRAPKVEEPSESDSDSDSDTTTSTNSDDSDKDEADKTVRSNENWAADLKSKKANATPSSKMNGTKPASGESDTVAPSKMKQESPDAKPAKVSFSDSSASESESEDSESESEDSSSSDSDDDLAKSAAKSGSSLAAKTGNNNESGSSSDESDDESENESQNRSKKQAMQKKEMPTQSSKAASEAPKTKKATAKSSVSTNGIARSKEFVTESDDAESDVEAPNPGIQTMVAEKQSDKTAVQRVPEIVTQGFHLRKAEGDIDAAAVAAVFNKAKAEGKQIWYFTTPKSVPIEVIQKQAIPLDKVHAGESIFTHENVEYTGHFEEPVNHAIKVLIPGKKGTNYETLNQPVDRVLHITRVTRFGQDGESQSSSASANAGAVSTVPRPQPKDLKARYLPFGVTNGDVSRTGADTSDGDEDVEMKQAPPLSASSASDAKADVAKKAAKKRKHGDVEKGTPGQEEAAATPKKKSKKPRVDDSSTPAVASSSSKITKQTPIAPPPVPPMSSVSSVKAPALPETAQPSPAAKKSKSKDKAKKKDTASKEAKPAETKMPSKVTPVLPPQIPGVKSA
ncbi:hypothetical protein N656DRAFT_769217 [Canariomyces notabilis]|uniref:Uncharacterized protein n=1 Tax=Canariomyces notabilis TaxID=2074819 RepID=A0AAN6YQE2_9PEZI|nr:hypothetical protein N656DRAFT_769217 [Canariomyces arenarius]